MKRLRRGNGGVAVTREAGRDGSLWSAIRNSLGPEEMTGGLQHCRLDVSPHGEGNTPGGFEG